ncbi:MAG: hypothetical protein JWM33_270 [Caulobacteraceae bacterium]|nr:hypothetical protein [Caulobacteraceae bacterium]
MSWKPCGIDFGCYITAAYDWQTLIGAIVAVAAALIAMWAVRKQLRHSDRQEQHRLGARDRAVRAIMPWALSAVVDYADRTAGALMSLHDAQREWQKAQTGIETQPAKPRLEVTAPPPDLLPVFERLIEATQSAAVTERLADIVAEMQVLEARLRDDGKMTLNPKGLILGALGLRAAATTLFQFARREKSEPDALTWSWVRNAAQLNPATRDREWLSSMIDEAESSQNQVLTIHEAREWAKEAGPSISEWIEHGSGVHINNPPLARKHS